MTSHHHFHQTLNKMKEIHNAGIGKVRSLSIAKFDVSSVMSTVSVVVAVDAIDRGFTAC